MRDLKSVNEEYSQVCVRIGHLEVRRTNLNHQIDNEVAPLHNRVQELEKEAEQINKINEEIAKLKSEASDL